MNATWKYKLKELFTFSKGERLGLAVLLLLVLVVLLYPMLGKAKKEPSLLGFDEFKQQIDGFEASARRHAVDTTLVIPVAGQSAANSSRTKASALTPLSSLELNSANVSLLTRLNGIGPHYAEEIVHYRQRLGGFCKPEQLMEVKGIGQIRFSKIATPLKVNQRLIARLPINTVDEAKLAQHPYVGEKLSRAIVAFRSLSTINSLAQLVDENILTEAQAERLLPYISFE